MQEIFVNPIRPGYEFTELIRFEPDCHSSFLGFSFLQVNKVFAQFRAGPARSDALLASLNTENQSITIVGADTIAINLSSVVTDLFPVGKPAWLDFAVQIEQVWRYIPALIPWPVMATVTNPAEV